MQKKHAECGPRSPCHHSRVASLFAAASQPRRTPHKTPKAFYIRSFGNFVPFRRSRVAIASPTCSTFRRHQVAIACEPCSLQRCERDKKCGKHEHAKMGSRFFTSPDAQLLKPQRHLFGNGCRPLKKVRPAHAAGLHKR